MEWFGVPRSRRLVELCVRFSLVGALAVLGVAQAQTLVPGHTPGKFSVSPSGAATYSIPIQVPPGVAGLVPNLSLNYSSQAGIGIAGLGWTLKGLSSITRCPATRATDGVYGSVNLNTADRFCLDGQRLLVVSGGYGAAGSEYRTEMDQFSRIIANGAAGGNAANGPESFTVYSKDGRILQYGSTAESRMEAQGKAVVATWVVRSISDIKGNTIVFNYTEDNANGDWRLGSLGYAGRAVHFFYEVRPDIHRGYQAGSTVGTVARLKQVETSIGTAVVQRTNLTYDAASNLYGSRLTSAQLCDKDNQCLQPITFDYPAPATQRLYPAPAFPETGYGVAANDYKYLGGDFNGDGRADLLHLVSNNYVHVWLSNANGTFSIKNPFPSTSGYEVGANNYNYLTGDFNGDGKTDLLHLIGPTQTRVWLSNGDGTFDMRPNFLPWAGYAVNQNNAYRYEVGDFNGDGRTDVLHFIHASGVNVWLSNGDGTFSVKFVGLPWAGYAIYANNYNYKLGDFNGDGLTDMVHLYAPTHVYVWLSKGDGTFEVKSRFPATDGYGVGEPSQQYKYLVGDFNGDGNDDMVHLANPYYVHVWFSKGDGTFAVSAQYKPWDGYFVAANSYRYEVGDFDGDGRQDLVHLANNSMSLWRSNGDGTFLVDGNPHQWPEYPVAANSYRYQTGDFNGDGKADLVHFIRSTAVHVWHSGFVRNEPVTSIARGSTSTVLSYQGLSAIGSDSVYTKSAGSVYPLVDIQPSVLVVKSAAQSNGVGGYNTSHYWYSGMKVEHASGPGKGRGNLGFAFTRVKEEASQMEMHTWFAQGWPYTGQVTRSETRRPGAGAANGMLKLTETQYNCYQTVGASPTTGCPAGASELIYQVWPHVVTEKSWDYNGAALPEVQTYRAYDGTPLTGGDLKQLGDITALRVDVLQAGVLKHRKRTVNEYHPARTTGTDWQIGRLKKATATSTQY